MHARHDRRRSASHHEPPHPCTRRGIPVAGIRRLRVCVAVIASVPWSAGSIFAQTFDQAFVPAFQRTCQAFVDGAVTATGNFSRFCNNQPTGLFSSPAGGAVQGAGAQAIEQRLQSVREAEEERREALRRSQLAYLGAGSLRADNGPLRLPPAGAAPAEMVVTPAAGLSAFFSTGATALHHRNNRYEDGYEATLPAATVGGDYWITPNTLLGLALDYTFFDAEYDGGGGFDKHIVAPQLYALFLPFKRAFAEVVLSYARSENHNSRLADVTLANGDSFRGHTASDFSENIFAASLMTGYDLPVGRATVGPRLGLLYAYSQVNDFKEEGDTGLELRYSGLDRSSLQSSVGALASITLHSRFGTFVPQVSAAWVHEYDDGARNVDAEFVDVSPSPTFRFKREKVASDWATVGVGLVALVGNGLQPFASFSTIQGNENFVSYGGRVGLRKTF